jgi:hypothetical protein
MIEHLWLLRQIERALQLRPAVERVSPLAGLHLDLFALKRKAVRLYEPGNRLALGLQAQTWHLFIRSPRRSGR